METTITIKLKDTDRTKALIEILKSMNFITSVDASDSDLIEPSGINKFRKKKSRVALESLAGIWKDRKITQNELREKAWETEYYLKDFKYHPEINLYQLI